MPILNCISPLVLLFAGLNAQARVPGTLDFAIIRAVPVQHDGRYPPVDTVARDVVEAVTGDAFFEGHDAVALLLAWTFDPQTWRDHPLIAIPNAELRHELRLPADQVTFSYMDLVSHQYLLQLIADLANIEQGRKMNPLESKVSKINEKLMTLQAVFQGQALRFIPHSSDIGGNWQTVRLGPAADSGDDVAGHWNATRQAFMNDDAGSFASASQSFADAVQRLPAVYRPGPQRVALELQYNRLRPFRIAWMIMVAGAVLAALAMFAPSRWLDRMVIIALVAGVGMQSYGLYLRWQIAGRIPASNMYESLLFLSWGMVAFAVVAMFVQRHRIVPLTASMMGALALLLAEELPLDSFVRPIPPVLNDTVWMAIHVPIIMVSYSVLALAVLIAHAQVIMMAFVPVSREVIRKIDQVQYWYLHVGSILLLAGILTGSIWAASSWGRYWGWDPKEVWSLVALLGYLCILHVRIDREAVPRWAYVLAGLLAAAVFALLLTIWAPLSTPMLLAFAGTLVVGTLFVLTRGEFATAVKSILAFWLIIMTYVGVNYVLGIGLHSYGFGTGAVASRMFLFGEIDLAVVGLCTVTYLIRMRFQTTPRQEGERSATNKQLKANPAG